MTLKVQVNMKTLLLFSNILHHKRSAKTISRAGTACILCDISLTVSGRQRWQWHAIITSIAEPPAETSISPQTESNMETDETL